MKPVLMAAALLAAGVTLAGVSAQVGRAADAPAVTPQRADDFQLTDHTRMAHRLYYYAYAPAIVLMSGSVGSAADLARLDAAYKAKGVLSFVVDSHLGDNREAVAAEAAKRGVTIPILMDEQQLVGESLGVQREGEVFVINPKTWEVAYHGPLAQAAPALDEVLAGKPVAAPRLAVNEGRAVSFPGRAHAAHYARISYAKDVAPILQAKCVSCHIAGGIGPFAMTGYDVIKGFSPMIRETVRTRIIGEKPLITTRA